MNYKTLKSGGISPYQSYQWPLPKNGKPGKWVKTEGELEICENGIHFCKDELQLLEWLDKEIWEIEVKGKVIEGDDKCAARQGRLIRKLDTWNEGTARLFACDCTERALHIFEDKYPGDERPRKAIEAARLFADGKATQEELSAVWSAARNEASAARYAAWAAARYAAGDAAGSAARYAASAERQWQAERLGMYLRGEL